MLEIIETVTMSPRQYKVVIEGMRNPMNSWGKSDSRCVGHYTGQWMRRVRYGRQ